MCGWWSSQSWRGGQCYHARLSVGTQSPGGMAGRGAIEMWLTGPSWGTPILLSVIIPRGLLIMLSWQASLDNPHGSFPVKPGGQMLEEEATAWWHFWRTLAICG